MGALIQLYEQVSIHILCSTDPPRGAFNKDKVIAEFCWIKSRHTHSRSSTQCIRVVLSAPAVLQWRTAVIYVGCGGFACWPDVSSLGLTNRFGRKFFHTPTSSGKELIDDILVGGLRKLQL